MNTVSISQLWSKAWDLFKVSWLLLLGILLLCFIVGLIPFIGGLVVWVIGGPALIRAGFLVAHQGKASFGEVFADFGALLKVFAYNLILSIVPLGLIGGGYVIVASQFVMDSDEMLFSGAGGLLVVVGGILYLIMSFFGWAGPYAILIGRAGVFEAIGQSFSLTGQNFGTVLLAWLSLIGLTILGLIPCGLGLLVVIPMMYVFWPLLYLGLTEGHSPTPPHTL